MIALYLLAASTAPASPPAAASGQPLSSQQLFDAATRDAREGRCTPAIPVFEKLAGLPGIQRNAAVLGTIKVRLGVCLYTTGRYAEARQMTEAGLPNLPADANYKDDRFTGNFMLGRLSYDAIDHAAARTHFEVAMRDATGPDVVSVHMWLARSLMFNSGPDAMRHADAALQDVLSQPKPDKDRVGEIRTVRARVMMNQGDAAGALKELRKSLAEQGGLTMKVTLNDVITRSDLAIAALLDKDSNAAREYMAYTGAGRFDDAFNRARSMEPPMCGGAADLKPQDSAIVEFSINDDGQVIGARPVWASRPGEVALEFARAVNGWSWAPEDARKIPAFFRAVTRVELKCENGTSRPSVLASLMPGLASWRVPPLPAGVANGADAVTYPKLLAALDASSKSGDTPASVELLYRLGMNTVPDAAQRAAWFGRAAKIAERDNAPLHAQAALRIMEIQTAARQDRDARPGFRALLADPRFAADPVTAATLRLLIAEPYYHEGLVSDRGALLNAVASDARLGERHPLRVAALLRLADEQARQGDAQAAQSSFERTGLDANQCALVAPTPALRAANADSGDFPIEAMRWGFEGWVRFELDVTADGKTANQRAIIVYPPFVFREAAEGIAKGMRFAKSYRPGGGTACTGYQSVVKFGIPK